MSQPIERRQARRNKRQRTHRVSADMLYRMVEDTPVRGPQLGIDSRRSDIPHPGPREVTK